MKTNFYIISFVLLILAWFVFGAYPAIKAAKEVKSIPVVMVIDGKVEKVGVEK